MLREHYIKVPIITAPLLIRNMADGLVGQLLLHTPLGTPSPMYRFLRNRAGKATT